MIDSALAALFAAQHPEAFAEYAAATGQAPPSGNLNLGSGAGGASTLAQYMDPRGAIGSQMSPLAGLKMPEAPVAPAVGTPGPPSVSAIQDPTQDILKLLFAKQLATAGDKLPGLASYMGK